MLRAFAKVSLGLALTLSLAAACGSDDGKKQAKKDEDTAGQGGQEDIGAGGGKNHAGEPGSLPGGAGGEAPVGVAGGAGGEAPVLVSGGAGGEAPLEMSGGAGGEGAGECCQPTSCEELGFCDYLLSDGCGHNVVCGCEPGFSCQSYHCAACEPDPSFCDTHCGATVDNCNNPLETPCPDLCGELSPGSICYGGGCCTPQTECSGQCGTISDGCGGTLDCGNNCEGTNVECGSDNHCCTANPDACGDAQCGTVWNNCNYIECGSPCESGQTCLKNKCASSECQAQGFDCGTIFNDAAGETETCGFCEVDEGCIDNHCTAICGL
jgi:hypothetical protein